MNLASGLENEDAQFILLVEKYSMFLELTEKNFHNDYRYIVITGTEMLDHVATRQFMKMVIDEFKLSTFNLIYGL